VRINEIAEKNGREQYNLELVRGQEFEVEQDFIATESYSAGSVESFELVQWHKSRNSKGRSPVLLRDTFKDEYVVTLIDGKAPNRGHVFRAHIEGFDSRNDALLITQKRLLASYREGQVFCLSDLKHIKDLSRDGDVYGKLFELEPGITAILNRPRDSRFQFWWFKFLADHQSEVVIRKIEDGRIQLGMHFEDLKCNEIYDGYVSGFLQSRDGQRRSGMRVAVSPWVSGMVFCRSLPEGQIDYYEEGESVRVKVIKINFKDSRKLYDLEVA
jgi:hypothetical protein